MRIIGYGICGPGEASRRMRETLTNLKALCDDVYICLNNAGRKERSLCRLLKVKFVEDNREWGKEQWRIKEEFVQVVAAAAKPDWLIALDMDETFDPELTRENLEELLIGGHASYNTFIVNHWEDGYLPHRSFFKVQMWQNLPDEGYVFEHKALHPGLVPKWAATHGAYAPYYVNHYGLKDKEDRVRKAERYDTYDPEAKYMSREYYDSLLKDWKTTPFDHNTMHSEVEEYVKNLYQPIKKIRHNMKTDQVTTLKHKTKGFMRDVPTAHVEILMGTGVWSVVRKKDDVPTATETTEDTAAENECDVCGKEFAKPQGVRMHKMRAHG